MKRTRLTIFLLIIASIVSAVITLCMGAVQIPVQDTLSVLLQHLFGTDTGTPVSIAFEQIVWQIRMPRIILGFLAGSGLALCGCVMQAVVQNPMADPYILGVSAGATLGATGSLFLGLGVISGFWAFVGAGSACFLVLALSSADGKTTSVKLILSGMIVNALLTAFSNFIIAVAGDSDGMMSIKFWTMGSLTRAGWKNIGLITLIVLAAAVFFRTQAQTLDGLMLGEEAASTIGINTFRCRLVYLLVGLKDKIVGVFDNDNALKGDIADEVASLNSLGDKKSVSKETILATEPDLILGKGPLMFTESSIGTVQSYQELGIPVYTELASASIDQSLDNIVEDVRNIGEIFNVQETANSYADELQERIDALMDKVGGQSGEPLKVLFMAGYADGTFVAYNSKMSSCMLNALNAENVLDKGGNGLTLENLVSMNPDIIVYVRADRFGAADADAVEQLTANAVVQEVPAIANQKVIEMDYDDVMDYGARVIDSAETLYNFMYSAS